MAEDHGTLRVDEGHPAFAAWRLFAALRLALDYRAIVLAAAALVLTSAGWRVGGMLFSNAPGLALEEQIRENNRWPWDESFSPVSPSELESIDAWWFQSPLAQAWQATSAPFVEMYRIDITFTHFIYVLTGALWTLAVWAFFGGAITRLAAVAIARDQNVSWGQLIRFAISRWPSYFAAPLFPILGTFGFAAMLAALGLLMRTDVGIVVAGILWPLALVAGFLMAFLLIVLFFGWPLMWGAISAEGTDAFGALSHSYSYTYQRPLQYLFYAVVAAIIGLLGWFIVALFAGSIISLAWWGVSWGSGSERVAEIIERRDLGGVGDTGASLILFWEGWVVTLALAYFFSYFWSATTVIYFLMRRLVDAAQMDKVFMPAKDEVHALPSLKTGPDGVADVADGADAG
jgi:hypothetical protein